MSISPALIPASQASHIPTFISYTSDLPMIYNYRDEGATLIYSFFREKYRIDKNETNRAILCVANPHGKTDIFVESLTNDPVHFPRRTTVENVIN